MIDIEVRSSGRQHAVLARGSSPGAIALGQAFMAWENIMTEAKTQAPRDGVAVRIRVRP